MALTAEQFGKAVVASGLVTVDELRRIFADVKPDERPKDGPAFATLLVARGAINRFQADVLAAGMNIPLVLGDYKLLAKIGEGGMGQVFKAEHRHMHRAAAIKLLSAAMTRDEEALKRFQREVKAAARLSHSNIVQTFDASVQRGVWYLAMEFVEGSDLAVLGRRAGPLPLDQALDYIAQAARGLAYAHASGVVHRDIKPANLLLGRDGTIKILDMGLARLEMADDAPDAQLTGSGMVMGTLDYMAPEQALDTRSADARADVYSLGCTLYRLLTATNPFGGESVGQKFLAHREHPIPSLRQKRGDSPEELDRIFRKMLAKDPRDRYQRIGQVADELEAVRKTLPPTPQAVVGESEQATESFVATTPPSRPVDTQQPGATLAVVPNVSAEIGALVASEPAADSKFSISATTVLPAKPIARSSPRKRPTTMIAVGALVVIVVIVGAVVALRPNAEQAAQPKPTAVPDGNAAAATPTVASIATATATSPKSKVSPISQVPTATTPSPSPASTTAASNDPPTPPKPLTPAVRLFDRIARLKSPDGDLKLIDPSTPGGIPLVAVYGQSRMPYWARYSNSPGSYVGGIWDAKLVAGGKYLITFGTGHKLRVWEPETNRLVAEQQLSRPASSDYFQVSADGAQVAAVNYDRDKEGWKVDTWSVPDLKLLQSFDVSGAAAGEPIVSPLKTVSVVGYLSGDRLAVWADAKHSNRPDALFVLDLKSRKIDVVAWSGAMPFRCTELPGKGGFLLVRKAGDPNKPAISSLWDVKEQRLVQEIERPEHPPSQVMSGVFSPSNRRYIRYFKEKVSLLDVWDGSTVREWDLPPAWKTGVQVLASQWRDEDNPVLIGKDMAAEKSVALDLATGNIKSIDLKSPGVARVEIKSSGSSALVVGDSVREIDCATGAVRLLLGDPSDRPVAALAFSPDERWLVFGRGAALHVVDMNDGSETKLASQMNDVRQLFFSHDARRLAAVGTISNGTRGSSSMCEIWDAERWNTIGKRPIGFLSHTAPTGDLKYFLSFRTIPDGAEFDIDAGLGPMPGSVPGPGMAVRPRPSVRIPSDVDVVALHPELSRMFFFYFDGATKAFDIVMEGADPAVRENPTAVVDFDLAEARCWKTNFRGRMIRPGSGEGVGNAMLFPIQWRSRGFPLQTFEQQNPLPLGRSESFLDDRERVLCTAIGFGLTEWDGVVSEIAWTKNRRYVATANGNGTVYVLRAGTTLPRPRLIFMKPDWYREPPEKPTPVVREGSPIGLLALLEPTFDTDDPEWSLRAGKLKINSEESTWLRIPVTLEGSYELEASLRFESADVQSLDVGLVVDGKRVVLSLDARLPDRTSGVQVVDGKPLAQTLTRKVGPVFDVDKDHKVKIAVQQSGTTNWSVTAAVDGQEIVAWQGSSSRLATPPAEDRRAEEDCYLAVPKNVTMTVSDLTVTRRPAATP